MISPSFKSIPPNCLIDTQYIEQIEFLGEEGWQWPILKNYLNEDSICYCAGAGDDISFETALFQCYRSNIFIIDPLVNLDNNGKKHTLSKTKDALEIIGNPDKVKLIKVALSDKNGSFEFRKNPQGNSYSLTKDSLLWKDTTPHPRHKPATEVPCKDIYSLMREYKHDKIDLLKLDIEGSEYKVLNDILEKNITIGFLNVEFHGEWLNDKWGNCAKYKDLYEIILKLEKKGFDKIFEHKYREYGFINTNIINPYKYIW